MSEAVGPEHGRRVLFRELEIWQEGIRLASGRTLYLGPTGAYAIVGKPLQLELRTSVTATVGVPRGTPGQVQLDRVDVPAVVRWVEDLGDQMAVALEFDGLADVMGTTPTPSNETAPSDASA